MKRILLSLMLLFFATQIFAIGVGTLRQTQYRWRNDDGNETTATWKAAANTQIVINDTSGLRLRIELDNNGTASSIVSDALQYSSDNGVSWTTMSNGPTQPFAYHTSVNVTNLQPTTSQMTGTAGTYVAGHVIAGAPGASSLTLATASKTELEWVIRPTINTAPNTVYTFRESGLEAGALNFPKIVTGCIGVHVLTKKDSVRCGPGTLTLNATCTNNATIQWYDASAGGNLLGTGTSYTTPILNTTTVYYVSAKLNSGAACESSRVPVTATVNPIPIVNLGPDITVCENVPVTLNAGGNYTYLWDNGSTNMIRTVNAVGSYFVTSTGIGGCKKSDTIAVNYNPRPIVNLGADTLICPGVKITLDAGNPGDTYAWDDGVTTQTRDVQLAGNYSVVVTNSFNCTGTDNINIVVKDLPLGEINAIYGDTATYTFNVSGALYAIDYIWDFGDGSAPVNGFLQSHTYTQHGIYLVKLIMVGDCDSNSMRERTIDVFEIKGGSTAVGNPSLTRYFNLYPNPAKETIHLSWNTDLDVREIEIFNILGQRVISSTPTSKSASFEIATTQLSNGIYSVRINTGKGFVMRKFEVRK